MNSILESKIISEINNPANTLTLDSSMGGQDFKITRDGQTLIYVTNAWDYGIWKVNVGGQSVINIEGGEKEYNAHPSKKALESIIRACQGRYNADKFRSATAGIASEIASMSGAERDAYDFLNRVNQH